MKWTAFVCFFCALTVGAQPAVSQAPDSEKLPSLEGKVTNSQTGQPLRKAYVILRPEAGDQQVITQSTDSQGQFKFSGIHPGSYRLQTIHTGFVGPESLPNSGGVPSVLRFDRESIAGLIIPMVPAGVFTGRVVDEDNDPMAKVRVQCLRFYYVEGKQHLTMVDSVTTDDRGRYRISGLDPGRYFLTASYSDPWGSALMAASDSTAGQGYATVYYPGALDAGQATELTAVVGEERELGDFRLIPVHLVSVTGRVSPPAGAAALGNVTVSLLSSGVSFGLTIRPQAQLAADGSFRIDGVAPGVYTLMAQDGGALNTRQEIKVGLDGLEGVSVTLSAGFHLSGRVRVEGSASLKAVVGMRIFLIPQDDMIFGDSGRGAVDAEGRFELNNVSPGDYRLQLDGLPEDFYIKSVRLAGQESAQKPLTVRAGNLGDLDLVVSPYGGHVGGTVTDDQRHPVSGATVVLVPEAEKRSMFQLYRTADTDQNGRFDLRGVPPGAYTAFAWTDIEEGAYFDPGVLAPYESKGKSVSVEEKSQMNLELNALPKN